MLGGKGAKGNPARDYNFKQANERLADQLNNSPNWQTNLEWKLVELRQKI